MSQFPLFYIPLKTLSIQTCQFLDSFPSCFQLMSFLLFRYREGWFLSFYIGLNFTVLLLHIPARKEKCTAFRSTNQQTGLMLNQVLSLKLLPNCTTQQLLVTQSLLGVAVEINCYQFLICLLFICQFAINYCRKGWYTVAYACKLLFNLRYMCHMASII